MCIADSSKSIGIFFFSQVKEKLTNILVSGLSLMKKSTVEVLASYLNLWYLNSLKSNKELLPKMLKVVIR